MLAETVQGIEPVEWTVVIFGFAPPGSDTTCVVSGRYNCFKRPHTKLVLRMFFLVLVLRASCRRIEAAGTYMYILYGYGFLSAPG